MHLDTFKLYTLCDCLDRGCASETWKERGVCLWTLSTTMASAPSASALSAVLRCRGNIWARNPPTKRPAGSAYSLGLSGGAVRDPPAERARAEQATARAALVRGERVVAGSRLAVAYTSPRARGGAPRGEDSGGNDTLYHPEKLSQYPGYARSAAPAVQSALVRRLARRLTSNLPGKDRCSQIIQMIKYKTYCTHICEAVFAAEINQFPAGVFKVSLTCPCVMDDAGQVPPLVVTGWSTLKRTCLSLTAAVSDFVLLKLAGWCSSSCGPGDVPQHLLRQQGEKHVETAYGQIQSPTDLPSIKDNSEDKPD